MKQFEAIIEKALQLLAPAHPVKVYISAGNQSYTDGENIVLGLPDLFIEETLEVRYGVLKALAFHELGHVLYSSMSHKQWLVDDLTHHFQNKFDIPIEVSAYVFRQLENAIEDGRIEFFINRQSQEMGRYLKYLNQRLFKGARLESSFDVLKFLDLVLIYSKLNDLEEVKVHEGTDYYKLFATMLKDLKKALREPTPKACSERIIAMVVGSDRLLAQLINRDIDYIKKAAEEPSYLEVTSENKVDQASRLQLDFHPLPNLTGEEVEALIVVLSDEIHDLTQAGLIEAPSIKSKGLLSERIIKPLGNYKPSEVPYDRIEVKRLMFKETRVPDNYISEGLALKGQIKTILDRHLAKDHRPLRSGKLNKKRLYRVAMKETKLFHKKKWIVGGAALSLLIDFSSSMAGEKIGTAIHAASVVEIGARGQVPVSISGYTTHGNTAIHYDIKGFEEHIIGMNYAYSFYKNAPYKSRGNRDDVAICLEANALAKRKERKKILFVISDGLPCVRDEAMLDSIQRVEDQGVDIYGLIIQRIGTHKGQEPEWFKKCVFTSEKDLLKKLNALIGQGIKGA